MIARQKKYLVGKLEDKPEDESKPCNAWKENSKSMHE